MYVIGNACLAAPLTIRPERGDLPCIHFATHPGMSVSYPLRSGDTHASGQLLLPLPAKRIEFVNSTGDRHFVKSKYKQEGVRLYACAATQGINIYLSPYFPLNKCPVLHLLDQTDSPIDEMDSPIDEMDPPTDEMDSPMEPLQLLPQQSLKSRKGARLVLNSDNTGYPESNSPTSPGRGSWIDNIASTNTKDFLRAVTTREWSCPAVVLMPQEYKLRVGKMSVTELRSQLEKFWGRGGIPGATVEDDDQDMWLSTLMPQLKSSANSEIFGRWVNRECMKWFDFFIANDHTFGVVHAWFAAFTGVTRESLVEIAEFFTAQVQNPRRSSSQTSNDKRKKTGKKKRRRKEDQEDGASMAATSHLKFRMSFDVCTEGYDAAVDGIPSLPLDTKTTTNKQGVRVIKTSINNMFPRRIWDICANTVIPATWFCGPRCPLTRKTLVAPLGVKPVLHAKVADEDLTFTMTEANQKLWPIRLPRGVLLEDVRQEMIRLGVRYAWLDILCLRQQGHPALAKGLAPPVSEEIMEKLQQRRLEEWKVDVPLIGAIYTNPDTDSLYGGGPTVIFMSGLGRPSRVEECASEQQWLRAWELQETPVLSRSLIAGLPEEHDLQLNSEVCTYYYLKPRIFHVPHLRDIGITSVIARRV